MGYHEKIRVIMKNKILFIIIYTLLMIQQISLAFKAEDISLPIKEKCEQLKDILTFDISHVHEDPTINITIKPISLSSWLYILKEEKQFGRINNFLKEDVNTFVDKENQVIIECKEAINQLDFVKSSVMAEKPIEPQKKYSDDKNLLPAFFNLEKKINSFYTKNKSFIEDKTLKIKNKQSLREAIKIFSALKYIINKSDELVPKMSDRNFTVAA